MRRICAVLVLLIGGFSLVSAEGKIVLVAEGIDNGSLAPDGRSFLVQSAEGNLALIDLETKKSKKILSGSIMDARLDPAGRRVLMLANSAYKGGYYYGLWIVNSDGSGFRPFLAKPELNAEERYPIWSPDGGSIAWARDGRVWIAAADGSGTRPVTPAMPSSFAFPLDWMGDELLFSRSDDPYSAFRIHRLNLKTGALADTGLKSSRALYFGSPDRLIYGEGPMRLWNVPGNREEERRIELGEDLESIQSLTRSFDCSRYLIAAGDSMDTTIQHLYLLAVGGDASSDRGTPPGGEAKAPPPKDAAAPAAAVSAAALNAAGAGAPDLADLAAILRAPLPALLPVKRGLIGLPKGYPADRALALDRLNQYRIAAGLEPYTYDAVLSGMGQAHADYILANAGTGDEGSHFERPGSPKYTKSGDEAARTSGIAYGEADPLLALEGLMGGTYHRLQFLRPGETRVGLGHSFGPPLPGSYDSGGTLFVTREGKVPSSPMGPRFVLFPPAGFDDTPTTFADGEFPDPRPDLGTDSPDTGFPITISLKHEDVGSFESATVVVKDEAGSTLQTWLSYPGRPAVANPDLGIYADDKAPIAESYRNNFNAVFILPKVPLAKGSTYSVRAELKIGGRTELLAWSFKTRDPVLWTVKPGSSNPHERLEFAVEGASEGDTILLSAGEYPIGESLIIHKAIRIIGEPGRTVLSYHGTQDMAAMSIDSRAVLRGLDFKGDYSFYLQAGSALLLKDCRFSHDNPQAVVASVAPGAGLVFEDCDFRSYASPYLAYFEEAPASAVQPLIYLGTGNKFGSLTYDGKRSYGPGTERNLRRSLE